MGQQLVLPQERLQGGIEKQSRVTPPKRLIYLGEVLLEILDVRDSEQLAEIRHRRRVVIEVNVPEILVFVYLIAAK